MSVLHKTPWSSCVNAAKIRKTFQIARCYRNFFNTDAFFCTVSIFIARCRHDFMYNLCNVPCLPTGRSVIPTERSAGVYLTCNL